MREIDRLTLARNIVLLFSIPCIVVGFVGLVFLRSTIVQVDFEGGSASGYLQSGKSYNIVGESPTRVYAEVRGTIYLKSSHYGSQEILRQEISLSFDPDEESFAIFSTTHMPITDFQVDESGEYLLSYEPSYTGTSGKIAIQESLIRSLLGIDEVILIVLGFAGCVLMIVLSYIKSKYG